ncbi:fam-b protein [Plasmodium berghei]|uniref:Fam-b protein n=3 Tax=Plasmodium berghei TaxID=5821 RepID=A0A509AHD9_PLABA|nr:fam-b protein [Plasmodium berghei ANKA]CXH97320.1 fam-b protein [Plasmodium berghei]SBW38105.1 fam-b protein [Plasmodium berghei]VUC54201.1 fam-b protein [Plasmodium berghei ANKA]|eukprot:XP_034420045.1 fam-b protein [Plasmodium berghei ANKA]
MKKSNIFNKILLLAIIICSLEYHQNELYNINEINIYPQRNAINFGNGRILAYTKKPIDLNYFYESVLTLNGQTEDEYSDEEILNLQDIDKSYINDLKNNKLENLKITISKTNNLVNETMNDISETMKCDDDKNKRQLESQKIPDNEIFNILGDNMDNKNEDYFFLSRHLESFKLFLDDSFMTNIDYKKIEREYNILFTNSAFNKLLRKHINKSIARNAANVILWNLSIAILSAQISFGFLLLFPVSMVDFKIKYNQLRKLHKIRKIMKKYSR